MFIIGNLQWIMFPWKKYSEASQKRQTQATEENSQEKLQTLFLCILQNNTIGKSVLTLEDKINDRNSV